MTEVFSMALTVAEFRDDPDKSYFTTALQCFNESITSAHAILLRLVRSTGKLDALGFEESSALLRKFDLAAGEVLAVLGSYAGYFEELTVEQFERQ